MSNIWCACTGRAQSAHIACRAHEPTRWPHGFGPLCSTTPRAPLLAATRQAAPATPGRPSASRRRRRQPLLRSAPPKPPRLATWPRHSPSSSTRVSASVRRRHVALATERRFAGELIPTAAEPTLARYKWTPRASPSTQATLCYPHGAPLPRIRPGEVSFLVSGNSCRRHHPGQSGTSSTSPSPFSSPGTFSSSCELVPLLDFDREPSPPQNHFAPEAPSAAKLVAGNSVHVGDHGGYPRVRLDLLSTSMHSDQRGTPPFTGEPRRSSAPVRSGGDDARVDQSNLTSGPGGPTVGDSRGSHAG